MPTGHPRKIIFKPFAKQARALECPAFELGYGGAPGGGKSLFLLVDALRQVAEPGYRALIVRRKGSDLDRSLAIQSHEIYAGRAEYNGQKRMWKFPNSSIIEFGHCQRFHDIYNYKSAQYSYLGFEQAEEFTEDMYTYLFTRVRTTNPKISPRVRCNFNPGGVGHQWIRERFWIGEREPNKIYKVKDSLTRPDGQVEEFEYGRAFIPSLVYDNPHIMKNDRNYLMRLMQLPEPTRTAYLEGRFDLFEGQFFKEWNPKVHVCDPFEIPRDWRRSIAFDWGYNDPMAMYWFAEDPKTGTVYVYRELYINQTIDVEVAKKMDELNSGEKIFAIYYPWDLDNINPQTGVCMRERMQAAVGDDKYWWKLAAKDRKNGWQAVRQLLSLRSDDTPRMKVFSSCQNLIKTFPRQIFDSTNSEDLDTDGDDHCCLIAGTKVLTHNDDYIGWQEIEDVWVGDEVLTREGFKRVRVSCKTDKDAEVFELTTTMGKIVGTADHPVFMKDGSKRKLGELRRNDELFDIRAYVLIQLVIWKLKSLLKLAKSLTEGVTTFAGNISSAMGTGCIGLFGNTITAQYQKASTFTIGTRTNPTTKFQTSYYCETQSIYRNTQENQKLESDLEKICSQSFTPQLKNGMDQAKVTNSTGGSEKECGNQKNGLKEIVIFAGEFTKLLSLNVLNFVISIAKWLSIVPRYSVIEVKHLPTKQSVYNLEVEGCHEYIANNLLVSNCDALRYFAASFRAAPEWEAPASQEKVYDLGGAIKKKNQFFMKQEQPMSFNWMVE